MNRESVEQIWQAYKEVNPDAPENYEDHQVWAFGNSKKMANDLLELVAAGTKTATASDYQLYGEEEPLPKSGDINIILNGDGEAVLIIETTSVGVVPFDEVTEEFAYLEGEGDRSLNYWRDVHETFFKQELEGTDKAFDRKMPVVCETFKVIYK